MRFADPSAFGRHKLIHVGYKPYECKVCQKRFFTAFNLKTHERTHTGECTDAIFMFALQ
jgi:KRAB domain-containing zinc finger protein